eukprot:1637559-Prymnesium_polylepis.1
MLGGVRPADELGAVRRLGATIVSEAALAERLAEGGVVKGLARDLLPELQKLAASSEATGGALHNKFAQDAAFTMQYGDLSTFFGGLEAKIGAPDPNVRDGMTREHTASSDSKDKFTTSNYGVTTTPELEWRFVAEPEAAGIVWPAEEKLRGTPENMRTTMTLVDLRERLKKANEQLEGMKEPPLEEEEAFGARLYTGPMCDGPSNLKLVMTAVARPRGCPLFPLLPHQRTALALPSHCPCTALRA